MHRRAILSSSIAALVPLTAWAQGSTSVFKRIGIAEIAEDAQIQREMSEQSDGDVLFVPPLFRYRVSVETAGRIQTLTDEEADTLRKWGTFVARPEFIAHFEQKVEVRDGETLHWIFWQRALVKPFRDELLQGGRLTINTILIGARRRRPLLLAIGYQAV